MKKVKVCFLGLKLLEEAPARSFHADFLPYLQRCETIELLNDFKSKFQWDASMDRTTPQSRSRALLGEFESSLENVKKADLVVVLFDSADLSDSETGFWMSMCNAEKFYIGCQCFPENDIRSRGIPGIFTKICGSKISRTFSGLITEIIEFPVFHSVTH